MKIFLKKSLIVSLGFAVIFGASGAFALCPIEDPGNPASYNCHVPECSSFPGGLDMSLIPRPAGGTYAYGSSTINLTAENNTSAYLCAGEYFDLKYQSPIVNITNGVATWTCKTQYSPSSIKSVNCSANISTVSCENLEFDNSSSQQACTDQGPSPSYVVGSCICTDYSSTGPDSACGHYRTSCIDSAINGVCGSSNGGSFDVAPTTNLCSYGTASAVSGNGPWSWTCNGTAGNSQSCSAIKSTHEDCSQYEYTIGGIDGSCIQGTQSHEQIGSCSCLTIEYQCSSNSYSYERSCLDSTTYSWNISAWSACTQPAGTCSGDFGYIENETRQCSGPCGETTHSYNCEVAQDQTACLSLEANYDPARGRGFNSCTWTPASGQSTQTRTVVCKDNNGNAVADNLCPQPKPASSQVGTAESCNTNGACGSSNGTILNTAPTSNLCIVGTPSTVNDNNGMGWTWSCNGLNGGLNAGCSATKSTTPSFAGACGSSNGGSFDVAPTTNLCSYGTASAVSGNGPWSWTCNGTAGNNQSCSAQKSGTSCTNTVVYEAPVVCDINDPQLAGVCYMPSAQSTLIVSNGNVGINNMDPEYPLDINGTMRAAEVLVLSDERAKENITKIDNALEKISKVHGYTFTWKKDGHPDMGVLAQEIEKVFNEAVRTDSTGVKTVQYNALIAPILEAIKELNTIIDAHSEKAAQQANDITKLEQKIQ